VSEPSGPTRGPRMRREVEDGLLARPAVAECAVIAAPDDQSVAVVAALIVPRPNAQVTARVLRDFVRTRLAAYRAPKRSERCTPPPASAVGNVLRRALRDPF
jgi:acyl-coenzyme A synthetase/AMP-(fatty) acid ligase